MEIDSRLAKGMRTILQAAEVKCETRASPGADWLQVER